MSKARSREADRIFNLGFESLLRRQNDLAKQHPSIHS
jgi:hypothetical protein